MAPRMSPYELPMPRNTSPVIRYQRSLLVVLVPVVPYQAVSAVSMMVALVVMVVMVVMVVLMLSVFGFVHIC